VVAIGVTSRKVEKRFSLASSIDVGATSTTVYMTDFYAHSVTLLTAGWHREAKVVQLGPNCYPSHAAATSTTVYVGCPGSPVIPISVATGQPGQVIDGPPYIEGIAVAPDSRTIYVLGFKVFPVDTASGKVGTPIAYGHPSANNQIVISPDGKTLYVLDYWSDEVVPISTATGTLGRPIKVARPPTLFAISPDGRIVLVGSFAYPRPGRGILTAISTATNRRIWTDRVRFVPRAASFGR
jgi:DNA-binding beta-propeller fold protein YncE